MSSNKRNLRLAGAFATLLIFGVGVGCTGFFVNPTITSITVDPSSPSVSVNSTTQLTAVGTDSNGNTYTLTGGTSCTGTTVCWSSSDTTTATVSSGGLIKGIAVGSATITASSGSATGTASATVTLGNVTQLTVSPTSVSLTEDSTATSCLTVMATVSGGGTQNVTSTATWVATNSSLITVENGTDPMCPESTTATSGSTTVYATYVSNGNTITSNTATVTVNP